MYITTFHHYGEFGVYKHTSYLLSIIILTSPYNGNTKICHKPCKGIAECNKKGSVQKIFYLLEAYAMILVYFSTKVTVYENFSP